MVLSFRFRISAASVGVAGDWIHAVAPVHVCHTIWTFARALQFSIRVRE